MNVKNIAILPFLVLISCFSKKQNSIEHSIDTIKIDSTEKIKSKIDSIKSINQVIADSLQVFTNGEIVSYCVLLPLNEFKENYDDEYVVKAQHKFILKSNPNAFDYIDVQGFFIDKENNFNVNLFYKRDIADIEEEGLGIETSYIDKVKNFYVIKGYLPNFMDKKFIQITWVNKDKVNITIGYSKNKEALWNNRIERILAYGMNCKN